jgi:hypothetical protein
VLIIRRNSRTKNTENDKSTHNICRKTSSKETTFKALCIDGRNVYFQEVSRDVGVPHIGVYLRFTSFLCFFRSTFCFALLNTSQFSHQERVAFHLHFLQKLSEFRMLECNFIACFFIQK